MNGVTIDRFDDYFRELHGRERYSWQRRLAERAVVGDWPPAIDLPTGSGKTACIDIAVFALACQASRPLLERNAARRIFFCVNRRVIVDEAHQRAMRIARAIWQAEQDATFDKPVLRDMATALRILAGTDSQEDVPPLDVLELCGGIYRDNRWARSPTIPTIVCTTIDQLGSRLLFRGYGVSPNAAPIQAALIAYDSLILLDEAHVSRPFLETLDCVKRYLDPERWAERPIGIKGARIVPMTATPPDVVDVSEVIRLDDDDRNNESLNNRLTTSKPAELREVREVVAATVEAASGLAENGPAAVGIIVNRVATARATYAALRSKHPDALVELVIGSMRPIDRDDQAGRLRELVGPGRPAATTQTSFVVATQCLEVGADYDFDGLVTECASLDALRQRFGRLNRGGRAITADGTILMPADAVKPKEPDPIYGEALPATWRWLCQHASRGKGEKQRKKGIEQRWIDFGTDSFSALLNEHGDDGRIPLDLLAPSAKLDAPVMLPVYVDFWCQTSPRPAPDPDVSLFLHGARRGEPDVQVCWRADIGQGDAYPAREEWADVVALLPPTSTECMSVPLSRVRRWLADQAESTDHGDLLGGASDERDDEKSGRSRPALKHHGILWRGAKDSTLAQSSDDLRPGDTLVLPVSAGGWDSLGHLPPEFHADSQDHLPTSIDCGEAAFLTARDRIALRIHPTLRFMWPAGAAVDALFDRLGNADERPRIDDLIQLLQAAAAAVITEDRRRGELIRKFAAASTFFREDYPDGRGAVLISRRRVGVTAFRSPTALDDGDDEPSRTRRDKPVVLAHHTEHVVDEVARSLSLLPVLAIADAFRAAAKLHDLGKADERFQAMLRRGDRTDAWLLAGAASALLAKSDAMPQTRAELDATRRRAGLPAGFRHEMLSIQFAEQFDQLSRDGTIRDLALHVVAAHHGHARPFAPVVLDETPPDVEVQGLTLTAADRRARAPHRINSGVAERFWSLTRCFGWWGLAYLEAILRLADQRASAKEDAGEFEETMVTA